MNNIEEQDVFYVDTSYLLMFLPFRHIRYLFSVVLLILSNLVIILLVIMILCFPFL